MGVRQLTDDFHEKWNLLLQAVDDIDEPNNPAPVEVADLIGFLNGVKRVQLYAEILVEMAGRLLHNVQQERNRIPKQ